MSGRLRVPGSGKSALFAPPPPHALEVSSPEGSVSHSDESDRTMPPSRVAGPSPYRNYRGNVSPAQEAVTSTPSSTSSLSRSLPHQPFLFQDLDDRGPGLRPLTAKVSPRDVSGIGDVLPDDVGDPIPPFSLNISAYVLVRRNAMDRIPSGLFDRGDRPMQTT